MTKSKSAGIAHANASRDPPASPTWDFGAVNRSRSYCPFCPTTKKEAELLSDSMAPNRSPQLPEPLTV